MCFKLLKKMCCMMVFATMVGCVVYYLKCKDENGREKGCVLAEEFRDKKEKIKDAAEDIKEDMSDIKDSAKSVFESGENA